MSEILFARLDEIVVASGGTLTNGVLVNPSITNPTFLGPIFTSYQPTNVGNAALFFSVPNRALGLLPTYNGFVFSQGSTIPIINQGGQNQLGLQQALVGTISLAVGDTKAGVGVAGYAESNSADPANAVGVFGQSQGNVAGASIFAATFVVQNIADNNAHGLNANYIAGMEINSNKWKNLGGTNTTVNGNHFYGINIQGGGNHTDEIGSAIIINNSAIGAPTRWANGVEFAAGSSINALLIGPSALGNNQGSQTIVLNGINSGGTLTPFAFFADASGGGYFVPSPNSPIYLQDGNGAILLATQATSIVGGNTGVVFAKLASAGVIVNNSTGVLSSTAAPTFAGTNITGTATSFTASSVTTNANLTGDVTSVGNATTLTNAPVIAKVLTGYVAGVGTVASTDTILQAMQKFGGLVDNAAWTAYTPTITSSAGTPTTVSGAGRYKQIGKTVFFSINVTVTTKGTAAGSMRATLPISASQTISVKSFDNNTGASGGGSIFNGAPTFVGAFKYDATTWWADGASVIISGLYEI